MNRNFTNVVRYVMDEWIPPVIRDSRWFMYPFFWVAYRGRNIREVMDFKRLVYSFAPHDYQRFYNSLNSISRNRSTDLNRQSLDLIIREIDPSAETLIDVGCGNGFLLKQVHEHRPNLRLTGLDIKDADENRTTYNYVKANVETMPFADKSFDVVTCSHTVEHLIRVEHCISELVRIARKQLLIVTPCQRYYYYTLDEHINFFPFKEKLTSMIPLKRAWCEKVHGDWVYQGKIE